MKINNMRDGYCAIVDEVFRNGAVVSPRGQETVEITDFHFTLLDPCDALPVGVRRGLNLGIAAYEAASLISGMTDPKLITRVAPHFADFMNHSELLGAYGPRIRGPLANVVRLLAEQPDTRQAVASIWEHKDPVPGSKDVPCTVNLQWLIRDGELRMYTTMRSNDVWLGLAYDVFQFTQLQIAIAGCLGVGVGTYHHHARSMHLYTRDLPAIGKLTPPARGPVVEVETGFGPVEPYAHPVAAWSDAALRARLVLGDVDMFTHRASNDAWYLDQLRRSA